MVLRIQQQTFESRTLHYQPEGGAKQPSLSQAMRIARTRSGGTARASPPRERRPAPAATRLETVSNQPCRSTCANRPQSNSSDHLQNLFATQNHAKMFETNADLRCALARCATRSQAPFVAPSPAHEAGRVLADGEAQRRGRGPRRPHTRWSEGGRTF